MQVEGGVVTAWRLELNCPNCGGDLDFVNGTRHGNAVGSLTVTITQCKPCNKQYEITTRLNQMAWTPQENNQRARKAS